MKVIRSNEFKAERAWGALDIERLSEASVRLHWTDQPYVWHVNEGPEVFVVLDGTVDMHLREGSEQRTVRLHKGDLLHVEVGDAHRAEPIGEARILVVERAGSI